MPDPLTPEELANGWTEEDLRAYQAERDEAVGRVGGFVVTNFDQPRPAIKIENTRKFNPHRWR